MPCRVPRQTNIPNSNSNNNNINNKSKKKEHKTAQITTRPAATCRGVVPQVVHTKWQSVDLRERSVGAAKRQVVVGVGHRVTASDLLLCFCSQKDKPRQAPTKEDEEKEEEKKKKKIIMMMLHTTMKKKSHRHGGAGEKRAAARAAGNKQHSPPAERGHVHNKRDGHQPCQDSAPEQKVELGAHRHVLV
jgi:hypothetical protein